MRRFVDGVKLSGPPLEYIHVDIVDDDGEFIYPAPCAPTAVYTLLDNPSPYLVEETAVSSRSLFSFLFPPVVLDGSRSVLLPSIPYFMLWPLLTFFFLFTFSPFPLIVFSLSVLHYSFRFLLIPLLTPLWLAQRVRAPASPVSFSA